jgi:hypothetical protein
MLVTYAVKPHRLSDGSVEGNDRPFSDTTSPCLQASSNDRVLALNESISRRYNSQSMSPSSNTNSSPKISTLCTASPSHKTSINLGVPPLGRQNPILQTYATSAKAPISEWRNDFLVDASVVGGQSRLETRDALPSRLLTNKIRALEGTIGVEEGPGWFSPAGSDEESATCDGPATKSPKFRSRPPSTSNQAQFAEPRSGSPRGFMKNPGLTNNLKAASVIMQEEKASNDGSKDSSRSSLSREELGHVALRALHLAKIHAERATRVERLRKSPLEMIVQENKVRKATISGNHASLTITPPIPSNKDRRCVKPILNASSSGLKVGTESTASETSSNRTSPRLSRRLTRAGRYAALKHKVAQKEEEDDTSVVSSVASGNQHIHPVFGYTQKSSATAAKGEDVHVDTRDGDSVSNSSNSVCSRKSRTKRLADINSNSNFKKYKPQYLPAPVRQKKLVQATATSIKPGLTSSYQSINTELASNHSAVPRRSEKVRALKEVLRKSDFALSMSFSQESRETTTMPEKILKTCDAIGRPESFPVQSQLQSHVVHTIGYPMDQSADDWQLGASSSLSGSLSTNKSTMDPPTQKASSTQKDCLPWEGGVGKTGFVLPVSTRRASELKKTETSEMQRRTANGNFSREQCSEPDRSYRLGEPLTMSSVEASAIGANHCLCTGPISALPSASSNLYGQSAGSTENNTNILRSQSNKGVKPPPPASPISAASSHSVELQTSQSDPLRWWQKSYRAKKISSKATEDFRSNVSQHQNSLKTKQSETLKEEAQPAVERQSQPATKQKKPEPKTSSFLIKRQLVQSSQLVSKSVDERLEAKSPLERKQNPLDEDDIFDGLEEDQSPAHNLTEFRNMAIDGSVHVVQQQKEDPSVDLMMGIDQRRGEIQSRSSSSVHCDEGEPNYTFNQAGSTEKKLRSINAYNARVHTVDAHEFGTDEGKRYLLQKAKTTDTDVEHRSSSVISGGSDSIVMSVDSSQQSAETSNEIRRKKQHPSFLFNIGSAIIESFQNACRAPTHTGKMIRNCLARLLQSFH